MRSYLITLVAATLLATPAIAEPRFEAAHVNVNVRYADLDLSKPTDAREMANRIHEAAARACGGSAGFDPYYHLAPASTVAEFEQCKQDATNGALQALNSPNVSRAYTESFTTISGR
ncbi:MAG: UrcA family protein [Pseudomonadota bacterium]